MNVKDIIEFIRFQFQTNDFIPLHAPVLNGNERNYLLDAVDSTFVSSVGAYVQLAEKLCSDYIRCNHSVAVVNGTSALFLSLKIVGVKSGDEVLTQALTFVATANSINYLGANPVFLDVDKETMGLSPCAISDFLSEFGEIRGESTYNKKTGKRIAACVPMHTFGFPAKIDEIVNICNKWNIPVVEDAAESLGSFYKGKHTGSFGRVATFSFNGNKIVTAGGGGMIVTDDQIIGLSAKHLSTTAKIPHSYLFTHDQLGYNFRMPNINASLLCAQLERLDHFLLAKRKLASRYINFFEDSSIKFRKELDDTQANYWLMCIEFSDIRERDEFLVYSNSVGVMSRPIWDLMFKLPMYHDCYRDSQSNAIYLSDRIVNIPSSVII